LIGLSNPVQMVEEGVLFSTWNFGPKWPTPSKTATFNCIRS